MIQHAVTDLSLYFRTGGVDAEKVRANFRAVHIRAGQGLLSTDPTYNEFYDLLDDVPRGSYYVFDGNDNIQQQVDLWAAATDGRRGNLKIMPDFEPSLPHTSAQAREFVDRAEQTFGVPAIVYVSPAVIVGWGYPAWLADYPVALAWYLYQRGTSKTYRDYDLFLDERGGALPPLDDRFEYLLPSIERGLWQFTATLDARRYAANDRTADPQYPNGLRSCDGSITFQDVSVLFAAPPIPDPEPEPSCCSQLRLDLAALEARVAVLEAGETPPPPPPDDDFDIRYRTTDRLNLRATPNAQGDVLLVIPAGETVVGNGESRTADGYTWLHVQYNDETGWAAENWLLYNGSEPVTMTVRVTASKLRVECIKGHDNACSGQTPPGKPVMEPWETVVRYDNGETLQVIAENLVYSCKDDVNTPTVKSSGGKLYYRVPPGEPGADAQFGQYPPGGYIDASKATVA